MYVLLLSSSPHSLSWPSFSLPPSRNSDPGSHSRLFSPLPTTVRALPFFYREKPWTLSSLVYSRLVEWRLPDTKQFAIQLFTTPVNLWHVNAGTTGSSSTLPGVTTAVVGITYNSRFADTNGFFFVVAPPARNLRFFFFLVVGFLLLYSGVAV